MYSLFSIIHLNISGEDRMIISKNIYRKTLGSTIFYKTTLKENRKIVRAEGKVYLYMTYRFSINPPIIRKFVCRIILMLDIYYLLSTIHTNVLSNHFY